MLKHWTWYLKYTLMTVHSSYIYQKYIHPFEMISITIAYIKIEWKVILTYKYWVFRLETFWEWKTEHIELITIRNGQWKALSIQNHQHYNGSQQDSGEMTLFLHCLTFLHKIFWYIYLRVFWNWNTDHLHHKTK